MGKNDIIQRLNPIGPNSSFSVAGPDWLLTRFGLLTLIGVLTRPGSNTLVERPGAAAVVVVIRFYD